MSKGRMEAFSDAVIAILITIMVLELHVPEGTGLGALVPLASVFLSYVLSFVNLSIYWNNHHHLLRAARVVDGRVLWANLHLLFWLSLVPFGTEVDGPERPRAAPDRRVWRDPSHSRCGVLHPRPRPHRLRGTAA